MGLILVKGKFLSSSGLPIQGVNVTLQSGALLASSNSLGEFSFTWNQPLASADSQYALADGENYLCFPVLYPGDGTTLPDKVKYLCTHPSFIGTMLTLDLNKVMRQITQPPTNVHADTTCLIPDQEYRFADSILIPLTTNSYYDITVSGKILPPDKNPAFNISNVRIFNVKDNVREVATTDVNGNFSFIVNSRYVSAKETYKAYFVHPENYVFIFTVDFASLKSMFYNLGPVKVTYIPPTQGPSYKCIGTVYSKHSKKNISGAILTNNAGVFLGESKANGGFEIFTTPIYFNPEITCTYKGIVMTKKVEDPRGLLYFPMVLPKNIEDAL